MQFFIKLSETEIHSIPLDRLLQLFSSLLHISLKKSNKSLPNKVKYKLKKEILTADVTAGLVGIVTTSVASTAGDGIRAASSVGALEWAMSRRETTTIARATSPSRLVAAVPARHYRVAKLVSRQTLSIVAPERSFRTFWNAITAHLSHKLAKYYNLRLPTVVFFFSSEKFKFHRFFELYITLIVSLWYFRQNDTTAVMHTRNE